MRKLILLLLLLPFAAKAQQTYFPNNAPAGTSPTTLTFRYSGTDSLRHLWAVYNGLSNWFYSGAESNKRFIKWSDTTSIIQTKYASRFPTWGLNSFQDKFVTYNPTTGELTKMDDLRYFYDANVNNRSLSYRGRLFEVQGDLTISSSNRALYILAPKLGVQDTGGVARIGNVSGLVYKDTVKYAKLYKPTLNNPTATGVLTVPNILISTNGNDGNGYEFLGSNSDAAKIIFNTSVYGATGKSFLTFKTTDDDAIDGFKFINGTNQSAFINRDTASFSGKVLSPAIFQNGNQVANDNAVVHNTGDETVAGNKTFTGLTNFNGDVNLGASNILHTGQVIYFGTGTDYYINRDISTAMLPQLTFYGNTDNYTNGNGSWKNYGILWNGAGAVPTVRLFPDNGTSGHYLELKHGNAASGKSDGLYIGLDGGTDYRALTTNDINTTVAPATGSAVYVQKSGDTMTGALINNTSIAVGSSGFTKTATSPNVLAHQGVAIGGGVTYIFDTGRIDRVNSSTYAVLTTNTTPFTSLSGVTHLGDGDYYNGILYVAAEKYTGCGSTTLQKIAKYDATTLAYISSIDVSSQMTEVSGIGIDAANGVYYAINFCDGTKVWKYDLATDAYIGTITLSKTLSGIQGITVSGSTLYLSTFTGIYSFANDGSNYNLVYSPLPSDEVIEGIATSGSNLLLLEDYSNASTNASVVTLTPSTLPVAFNATKDGNVAVGSNLSVGGYGVFTANVSAQTTTNTAPFNGQTGAYDKYDIQHFGGNTHMGLSGDDNRWGMYYNNYSALFSGTGSVTDATKYQWFLGAENDNSRFVLKSGTAVGSTTETNWLTVNFTNGLATFGGTVNSPLFTGAALGSVGSPFTSGYITTVNSTNEIASTSVTTPTLYGSAASGGTATISSTSNATKGTINIGTSRYNETTNQFGIAGTPRQQLSVGSNLDLYSGSSNTPTVASIRASGLNNLIFNAGGTADVFFNADAGSGLVRFGTSTLTTGRAFIDGATGNMTSGVAGTVGGAFKLAGLTSGTITIQPQSIAGTYNFNLPTTAGTSGFFQRSGGGGSSPMTWFDLFGTSNTFNASQAINGNILATNGIFGGVSVGSAGAVDWTNGTYHTTLYQDATLTAANSLTLPKTSGTIALTSDLPTRGQITLVAGVGTATISGLTTGSIATTGFVSIGGTVTTTWQYKTTCTANTLTITAITNTGTTNTTDTSVLNYSVK